MSSPPFRELFVELPSAVLEVLRDVCEQAVAHQPTAKPSSPSRLSSIQSASRVLADRWAVASVDIRPSPMDTDLEFRLTPWCSHTYWFQIDERELLIASAADVLDMLDHEVDRAARRCFCVQREVRR